MSLQPQRVIFSLPIDSGAGNAYGWVPMAAVSPLAIPNVSPWAALDESPHPKGRLLAVKALRLGANYTLTSLRLLLAQPSVDHKHPAFIASPAVAQPTVSGPGTYLFDSGVKTALLADTDPPVVLEHLGVNKTIFSSWFLAEIVWASSAGAGSDSVTVILDLELER